MCILASSGIKHGIVLDDGENSPSILNVLYLKNFEVKYVAARVLLGNMILRYQTRLK